MLVNFEFEEGKNSVLTKIDGKISFPDRKGPQPSGGEIWEVEISGQNRKGTVNFLNLVNGPMDVDHNAKVGIRDGALFNAQNRLRKARTIAGRHARIEIWEKTTTRQAKNGLVLVIQGKKVLCFNETGKKTILKAKDIDFSSWQSAPPAYQLLMKLGM